MDTHTAPPPRTAARRSRFDSYLVTVRRACSTPAGRAALQGGLADGFRHPWPMFEHLLPHGTIPAAATSTAQYPYLLIASLYALHEVPNPRIGPGEPDFGAVPVSKPWQNLGWSYRMAVASGGMKSSRAEDDLAHLAQLMLPALYEALPGVVGQLRGKRAPVEWATLLRDLTLWQRRGDEVRIRWARAFYQPTASNGDE
ncbi:type I-E CRISPR-associated protein Cse2/CasB [Kitasatospora sp. NPDC059795]|uniref:type I-E CRISPR-associated protein Cse2/CasB n=1 Tax=Kitasatospora sp. NPDC059795 TaxID=3346949 RepID=UPI003666A3E0